MNVPGFDGTEINRGKIVFEHGTIPILFFPFLFFRRTIALSSLFARNGKGCCFPTMIGLR